MVGWGVADARCGAQDSSSSSLVLYSIYGMYERSVQCRKSQSKSSSGEMVRPKLRAARVLRQAHRPRLP
jgi:hypothetical protein